MVCHCPPVYFGHQSPFCEAGLYRQERIDDATIAGHQVQARLRSAACCEASFFLGMPPMSAKCCFCEQHAAPPRPIANAFGRPSDILWCQELPAPTVPDHPMVCKGHKMGVMMRRDMLLGAWHCIAHRAGDATAMSRLWPRGAQPTWDMGGTCL
jgi:hypothetical protein